MQRDTWPPMPPSQTTLIRLYQMGVTFPPTPLSRPCPPQLQGQNNKGEWGQAGQPTGYSETMRCATREWSETVTHNVYMDHLFLLSSPVPEWFECLGASLPQALHRLYPAHQGCGSHAHTLGDIFVLFLSVSLLLLFFPLSLRVTHVQ